MTRLREAYQYNNIDEFQRILRDRQLRTTIMNDTFIKENIDSLLKLIRTQVLVKLIKPYTRVKLASLAGELNIEYDEVESLLITCILDNQIQGKIDQVLALSKKTIAKSNLENGPIDPDANRERGALREHD